MNSEPTPRENSTESNYIASRGLDAKSVSEIINIIISADERVLDAVRAAIPAISEATEVCLQAILNGGRVIYVGAGTSGRIAAQDVVELYPTYGIGPEQFRYVIAGGRDALERSIEGAEDDTAVAILALNEVNLTKNDIIIGISASGRTPFVVESIKEGKRKGCYTIGIVNNRPCLISSISSLTIYLATGPEVIQGSTRMKAGTAQKMVLNAISTAVATKFGRVYGNMMSHMGARYNSKLKERAVKYLIQEFQIPAEKAESLLEAYDYKIWKAIDHLNRNHN